MTQLELVSVPVSGADDLMATQCDGRHWVAIKPMCEALGIDAWGQVEKLQGQAWATTKKILVVAADGKTREMQMIDSRNIPMWLAGINENKVNAEARPNLIVYQREACDALDAYFNQRTATVVPAMNQFDVLRAALDQIEAAQRDATEAKTDSGKAVVIAKQTAVALSARLNRTDARVDALETIFQPPKTPIAPAQGLIIEADKIIGHAPATRREAHARNDLRSITHCCYGFHFSDSDRVKIGKSSTGLFTRWQAHESGRIGHLVFVWVVNSPEAAAQLETELRSKFSRALVHGREWFAATAVLPVLRDLRDPKGELRWPTQLDLWT
jgi:hypothetical protein